MILDYTEMIKLVRIRQKQVTDASLVIDKYNVEFVKLKEIEQLLADLIINNREKDNYED